MTAGFPDEKCLTSIPTFDSASPTCLHFWRDSHWVGRWPRLLEASGLRLGFSWVPAVAGSSASSASVNLWHPPPQLQGHCYTMGQGQNRHRMDNVGLERGPRWPSLAFVKLRYRNADSCPPPHHIRTSVWEALEPVFLTPQRMRTSGPVQPPCAGGDSRHGLA